MLKKKISFIIPVFNEERSVEKLYLQIRDLLATKLKNYLGEIIFINDGSTDQSLSVVKNLRTKDYRIGIISFRKNLGKATALYEGFKKSSGDLIVTMDADLQDDPDSVPELIQKINEGYDLVVGWKKYRQDSWDKTMPSKIFNFLLRSFSATPLHDFNSGLKLFTKDAIKDIRLYGELHRFIPLLVRQRGFEVAEIPVNHRKREFGKSKYGWTRLIKGFFDFLTVMFLSTFGQKPLHFFGVLGLIGIIVGVLLGAYLSILWFQGYSIGGRPLLILSVLLIISGIQLGSTGLIGEMIVSKSRKDEKLPIDFETKQKK